MVCEAVSVADYRKRVEDSDMVCVVKGRIIRYWADGAYFWTNGELTVQDENGDEATARLHHDISGIIPLLEHYREEGMEVEMRASPLTGDFQGIKFGSRSFSYVSPPLF